MASLKQSSIRQKKYKIINFTRTPALTKRPQIKGIVSKVTTMSPKKPNSACRKVAKVKVSTGRKVEAYIPGEGHTLQQHSTILMRGGRVKDLPGVKYHLIRGKFDFKGVKNRKTRRSIYGVKKS